MRKPHQSDGTVHNPRVDGELMRLVEQCLAIDPEKRPAEAKDVAARLVQIGQRLRRRRERLARLPVRILGALGLAVVLTGTAGAAIQFSGPQLQSLEEMRHQGEIAFKKGDLDLALNYFHDALQQDQESAETRLALAETYLPRDGSIAARRMRWGRIRLKEPRNKERRKRHSRMPSKRLDW